MLYSYTLHRFLRSFRHNRFYSLLNLTGLVTAIASCLLVMLYVLYQSDFDAYHKNASRTARLSTHITMGQGGGETPLTSICLAPLLKKNNPFIVEYTRFNTYNFQSFLVTERDRTFKESGFLGAEPSVFRVFTHPMLAGNPATALNHANSIVLTRALAMKYFGTIQCLGNLLKVDYIEYAVTGVIEDLPGNSDLKFKALISEMYEESEDWDDARYWSYVVTEGELPMDKLDRAMTSIKTQFVDPFYAGTKIALRHKATPLQLVHFTHGLIYDTPKSKILYVYVFLVVGFFILCIACFNYINLSALQSFKRSKEVGIKAVLGATRFQLIGQFVGESLILTLTSLTLAIVAVAVVLPFFNTLMDLQISISALFHWKAIAVILITVMLLGMISSVVPATYVTSFGASTILKQKLTGFKSGFLFKMLLTLQFSMSVTMMMGAIAVYTQVSFMHQRDLGIKMDQVLIVRSDLDDNINLKKQLQQFITIKGVSLIGEAASPGSVVIEKSDVVVEREGEAADMDVFNTIGIDEDYFEVLGINLIQGRNFNPDIPDDTRHAFIVNEAFVRRMGWKKAIDKKLELHGPGKVIGVVKDFNYKSLHNVVEPLIMHYNLGGPNNEMLVKISAMSDVDIVKDVWRKVVGNEAMDYSFLDSNFESQYRQEQTVMTMFLLFSFLAIAQTCQGLFGLSSLITRQRLKEIGIRKVLGGTEPSIIYHLLKDMLVLLLVSFLLALPISYYGIDQWIRDFAYRADVGIWHYFVAWLLTVICTVMTAFYHTHKGMRVNPAVSLRYEE